MVDRSVVPGGERHEDLWQHPCRMTNFILAGSDQIRSGQHTSALRSGRIVEVGEERERRPGLWTFLLERYNLVSHLSNGPMVQWSMWSQCCNSDLQVLAWRHLPLQGRYERRQHLRDREEGWETGDWQLRETFRWRALSCSLRTELTWENGRWRLESGAGRLESREVLLLELEELLAEWRMESMEKAVAAALK